MRVLVTRPVADAERTARLLRALGHEPLVAPLARIEPVSGGGFSGEFSAVLCSSAHAVDALPDAVIRQLRDVPAFVVGGRTGQALKVVGFANLHPVAETGADLVQAVIAALPRGARCLYLAGEPRKPVIEQGLRDAGLLVETHLIYRTVYAADLPPVIVEALGTGAIDAVLHFSREAAQAFAGLVSGSGLAPTCDGLLHICLSEDVAAGLAGLNKARIVVSLEPRQAAMLALIDKGR